MGDALGMNQAGHHERVSERAGHARNGPAPDHHPVVTGHQYGFVTYEESLGAEPPCGIPVIRVCPCYPQVPGVLQAEIECSDESASCGSDDTYPRINPLESQKNCGCVVGTPIVDDKQFVDGIHGHQQIKNGTPNCRRSIANGQHHRDGIATAHVHREV